MQAEPAFQAAEVFWMEMLVSTAFFFLCLQPFRSGTSGIGRFQTGCRQGL